MPHRFDYELTRSLYTVRMRWVLGSATKIMVLVAVRALNAMIGTEGALAA